jgi:hypothetical protein
MSSHVIISYACVFLSTLLLIIFRLFILKGLLRTNPVWLFAIFNWIMAVGTFTLLDFSRRDDAIHALILFITAIIFYVTSAFFLRRQKEIEDVAQKFWQQPTKSDVSTSVGGFIFLTLIVAPVVSVLYYHTVSYNVLFLAVRNTLYGQDTFDFATLRLQTYAGATYFAPGYVNQFKNMLFPLSLIYFCVYGYTKRLNGFKWLALELFPVALIFLLGTGQRGAFVLFTIIAYYALALTLGGNLVKRYRNHILILGIVLFFGTTILQGRYDPNQDFILGAVRQTFHRILGSNQVSSLYVFHYVYEQDITYGREWMKNAAGLLPGVKGSDLLNQGHYIILCSVLFVVLLLCHYGDWLGTIHLWRLRERGFDRDLLT